MIACAMPRFLRVLAPLVAFLAAGCGGGSDDPMEPDAPPSPTFDAAVPAEPCAAPTGAGTEHAAYVTADETWTAAASPHIVTFDIAVQGATLTIEPCAVVRIRGGYHVSIGLGDTGGSIVAHGEVVTVPGTTPTSRPVTIEADDVNARWGSFRVFPSGSIDLELVTIQGAGEPSTAQNGGGAIVAVGGGGTITGLARIVRTVNVLITGSAGLGVNLQGKAAFTEDSRDLTIRDCDGAPLSVAPPAVQSIPTGTYTGNAVDAILVPNDSITGDETFHARGLPYRLAGTFTMAPTLSQAEGGLATLTIEAGVTIEMARATNGDNAINLGNSNDVLPTGIWPVRVVADGTAAPIVFTSTADAPAAGDWAGIEWGGGPPTGNVMSNVRIEYAGGNSGTQGFGCGPLDNDAALILRNWRPADAFLTGSTIASSASGGVVSGWATDLGGPDLSVGNTFTGIASGCNVARWKNVTSPTCPGDDGVPDCL